MGFFSNIPKGRRTSYHKHPDTKNQQQNNNTTPTRTGVKRGHNNPSKTYDMDIDNVYCPECGSPRVHVYSDGSCECLDCKFPFHINYIE